MLRITIFALFLSCALCSVTFAEKDKSEFNLFNPTPPDQLRDLNTDRPNKTEGPYTVDAGHMQLEMDLVKYSYDRQNPQHEARRVQTLNILSTDLRIGLLDKLEFDLISDNFLWFRDEDLRAHQANETSGAGDTTLRFKLNLWGNGGGKSAFGLIPYITLPTASDDLGVQDTEFGLIVPLALSLPHDFGLGLMTKFDWVRDERDDLNFVWVNSITLSHEIVKNPDGYIELFTAVDPDRTSSAEITFDFGVTYALNENMQLDAGLNIGLTREPDDWNPFIGLSLRY
jgi:hypothetical protein